MISRKMEEIQSNKKRIHSFLFWKNIRLDSLLLKLNFSYRFFFKCEILDLLKPCHELLMTSIFSRKISNQQNSSEKCFFSTSGVQRQLSRRKTLVLLTDYGHTIAKSKIISDSNSNPKPIGYKALLFVGILVTVRAPS